MQTIKGTVMLVAGASTSKGIGAAFARLATKQGARLALLASDKSGLDDVAASCGTTANVLSVVADMTKREEVDRAVATVIDHFDGRLDVLVNTVGRGINRSATALTSEDIDEMMLYNVKTALFGMQAVLPHFQEQGQGHIINVSSKLGRQPIVGFRSAYNGAKHFLNALTANFRMEISQTHPDVAVSLVSPGLVYTDFGMHGLHSPGDDIRTQPNGQEADEIANVILQVVRTRAPDVYTKAGYKAQVMRYLDDLSADPSECSD